MFKKLILFTVLLSVLGCTDLDDRHVFNFKITGAADSVDNMRVKMGPGVDFDSEGKVSLPVDISHDVYGNDLIYFFEILNSDENEDINLTVIIDGKVIEEKSEFDVSGTQPKITIEGIFN